MKKVILYYDNGQKEINNILNTVFATELSAHETRLAYQKDYRLSQVADMICTLKLLEDRANNNSLCRSEELVFGSRRVLIKDFIKLTQANKELSNTKNQLKTAQNNASTYKKKSSYYDTIKNSAILSFFDIINYI